MSRSPERGGDAVRTSTADQARSASRGRVARRFLVLVALSSCFTPVDGPDGGSTGGGVAGGGSAGGASSGGSSGGATAGGAAGGATAGGSAGGSSGGATAGGSAGGSTAGGSSGGTAGGGTTHDGGLDCATILSSYSQALVEAKRCASALPVVQCTFRRPQVLGCPTCTTFVNSVGNLDSFIQAATALGCSTGSCPFVCGNPASGACVPDATGTMGSCEDRP